MKLKLLGVFLLVICLMSSTVFATYNWMQADGSTPQYAATDNWTEPNQWDTSAHAPPSLVPGMPAPPNPAGGEIKMITNSGTGGTAHCTINSNIGSYTGVNTSVNGNLYINNSSAVIGFNRTGSGNGLRVGSNTAGGTSPSYIGNVAQSAGTVTATNVYLGYGGSNGNLLGTGNYVIMGGSLTCSTSLTVGGGRNTAVGSAQQTIGKFTVDGPSPTISVTALRVGGTDVTTTTNSGTLEFKLGSGVSAIGCTSVNLDAGGVNATTALIVSATSAPPASDILLVNQSGAAAVVGTFDTVTGDQSPGTRAENGDLVKLTFGGTDYYYNLYYDYDSAGAPGNHGSGNDIALVIPEPATLALLGLGLLAIRRR